MDKLNSVYKMEDEIMETRSKTVSAAEFHRINNDSNT